jgi:putative acetyltransferase
MLMNAVIELADDWLDLRRLGLIVFVDNTHAIELYRRLGFVIEGTLRGYAFKRGALVDAHVMARLRGSVPTDGE